MEKEGILLNSLFERKARNEGRNGRQEKNDKALPMLSNKVKEL